MPTVVMKNISRIGLLESDTDIVVLLDGKQELKFSRDTKVEFLVERGTHTLQVRVGGVHSLPTTFQAAEGDVVAFECSRSGMWEKNVVLTPIYHNRSHPRFNVEQNEIARVKSKARASKAVDKPHWSTTLHVAPDASMEEIEDAYQRLMRAYTPERMARIAYEESEDFERTGRDITEAYETARNEKQP